VIGVPPAYRGYSLMDNHALGLRDMVGARPYFGSYAEFEDIYSRGWALTHYLTFDPKRRGQFDRYIGEIQKGVPPLTAAEQAFGDLGALSAEIESYIRRPKLPHLILTGITVPPGSISIRKLTPAEAEIMPTYVRMERKLKSAKRDVASDAAKLGTRYPADSFVQETVAEAALDARDYPAADAASARALAASPNNFAALMTQGKAQMEFAHASGSGDWHAIRGWFLRANKIDHEAAEPLMMFYKTYLYAGERPTKNAVDGLLYALALAPQDSSLRLMAVRQLLLDGNVGKAKEAFAPFAYSPHSKGVWRASSAKALAAMDGGKSDEAVTQIVKLQQLLEDEED
jgi:hypothetical protein